MPQDHSAILSRFLSMSRAIAGQLDYQSALQGFADELSFLIPHDHLDICLLANGSADHVCYEVGMHTSWSQLADQPLPTRLSPIRSVLWGKVPSLLTDDALVDPRFHFDGACDGPIYAAELRSRIIVPLRVQGAVIGSLAISRHEPGCFGADNVEIAQHGADLLAPYLYALARGEEARKAAVAESEARAREEILRLGALRLTEGMERERQRLGMDLHDQTLADLARIFRRVSGLARQARVTADDLRPIGDELDVCLHELRRIVEDTKPGVLQLFGFAEAVDALLRRSVADAHPPIETLVEDDSGGAADRLPETMRTSLYRIVQEAVNNAVRHSGTRRVGVRLRVDDRVLDVEIEDAGRGCDPRAAASRGGIGNMETRAALMAARIRFAPGADGTGTRVCAAVPLEEPVAATEATG